MKISEKLEELERDVLFKQGQLPHSTNWLDPSGEIHPDHILAYESYETAKRRYEDFLRYILYSKKELYDEYNEEIKNGV